MKVTLKLLKDWGACKRYLEYFKIVYPDGFEGTIDEIVAEPNIEEDRLWFLYQAAYHLKDKDGDQAFELYLDRADPFRIAKAIIAMPERSNSRALEILKEQKEPLSLGVLVLEGNTDQVPDEIINLFVKTANEKLVSLCKKSCSSAQLERIRISKNGI